MTAPAVPRTITSVLVEEAEGAVTVTWGLGHPVAAARDHYGYGLMYYGPDGNGGKHLGVRISSTPLVTAFMFDNNSSTQANYDAQSVTITDNAIVVSFNDATLGLAEIGTIHAYAHIDSVDVQTGLDVTVLR